MTLQPQVSRPDAHQRRLSLNITPAERIGRVVLGGAATLAGILLIAGAGSTIVVILAALLAVAGLDLVVTGAIGHCPLYQKLGFVPRSMRGAP
jgi:hypothetical protein